LFRFGFSEYLYLLLLVPVALGVYVYGFRRKQTLLSRFGNLHLVKKLSGKVSLRRRRIKAIFLVTSLFLMLLALARPQFGTRVETIKREGQDIFVALDVSLSMLAQDIRPSRLEKAKREVGQFIDGLEGDRIGLIAFAGEAFVQCPLTLDYGAARLFLSAMGPEMIPVPGTAIGEAIRKAMVSFSGEDKKSKVLIIITDGEDHMGGLPNTLKEAVEAGVVIYTIGIGTQQGVPIPDTTGGSSGSFRKDRQGAVILTRLNESGLREIAETTGGEHFRVTANSTELDQIYAAVAGMDKKELSARQVTLFDEKFQPVLCLALILLTLEFFLSGSRSPKREWKGRFH
jgi:Ca-activated chloride channel family protein